MKSSLHFFAIDEQIVIPHGEMMRLDAEEAVQAAKNSHGKLEVYVWYEDNMDPDVGYVFEGGKYVDTNLGTDRTAPLTEEMAEHFGEPVADRQEAWLSFFNKLDNG